MKKMYTILCVTLLVFLAMPAFSQPVLVPVASGEGTLNAAIDAAVAGGTISNTIFQLEPYGYYYITGTITVPAGNTLTIEGPEPGSTQATAPAQILWTINGSPDTRFNFNVAGNVNFKHVWIVYGTATGAQVGSSFNIAHDSTATNGQTANFEGCIFDYSPCPQNASGAISVSCRNFKGNFKNCYWKNCIDPHYRYYGRAVSFPYQTTEWHTDSITFENCTFANMGYVYMQEGGEYGDYVKFNHCTFLNVVMHVLETGWWKDLAVTNCLFVNTWMYGDIPQQTGTGDPNGGTLRIDSVGGAGWPTVPWTNFDRRIAFYNSAYYLEPWLTRWMRNNPYSVEMHRTRQDSMIPVAMPMLSPTTIQFFDSVDQGSGLKMFPRMNRGNLINRTENPGFTLMPQDTNLIKAFLFKKWGDATDTNWAWNPANTFSALWPLEEDLDYSNATLKTAGLGGFPLGDLYWWNRTQYTAWAAQKETEDAYIEALLNGSTDVKELPNTGRPEEYSLSQNFPNPFNPITQINYSVPEKGQVTLKVYSILGQEVATLFNGVQPAGNYVATFDGKNLASGVYFYRLQAGNVSMVKKLMLMK